jgi:NADH-quinone oxidoreductase subunit M
MLGALVLLFLPNASSVRWTALGVSLLAFVVSLVLIFPFKAHWGAYPRWPHLSAVRLMERTALIPSLHVFWLLGLDGLSLPLILLISFVFPLVCAASWKIAKAPKAYFALLLSLQTMLLGLFLSLDLVLFFCFLQILLLHVYLLLRVWGGPRKRYGPSKFALYMLIASAATLIVLIAIWLEAHSFDLIDLPALLVGQFGMGNRHWHLEILLFVLSIFAVSIGTAGVPLHTWLLDALSEAPAASGMLIAALLLPIGDYALFRIVYPLFPEAAQHMWLLVALIGIVSILYGALCALAQTDLKRLLAYSSISQMGFILLGAAVMTPAALRGALFMMIAHGVTCAMMFFSAGVLFDRAGHRDLLRFGGLASTMPRFFGLASVGFFATAGFPGLCGFVGEILVILGLFQSLRPDSLLSAGGVPIRAKIFTLAILATLGLILGAAYTLLTLQRIFFGAERTDQKNFREIDQRETAVLATLASAALLLGLFPSLFVFSMTGKTIDAVFGWFDKSTTTIHPPSPP